MFSELNFMLGVQNGSIHDSSNNLLCVCLKYIYSYKFQKKEPNFEAFVSLVKFKETWAPLHKTIVSYHCFYDSLAYHQLYLP